MIVFKENWYRLTTVTKEYAQFCQ